MHNSGDVMEFCFVSLLFILVSDTFWIFEESKSEVKHSQKHHLALISISCKTPEDTSSQCALNCFSL